MNKLQIEYINSLYCKDYILDSGAFTFLNNRKRSKGIDFMEYTKGYIDYINTHTIKKVENNYDKST